MRYHCVGEFARVEGAQDAKLGTHCIAKGSAIGEAAKRPLDNLFLAVHRGVPRETLARQLSPVQKGIFQDTIVDERCHRENRRVKTTQL